jgi:hypothetical protein
VFVLFLSLLNPATAAEPVVAAGNGLVASPPDDFVAPKGTSTWVSVLADCLEEARPGVFSVVDRSRDGVTTKDVEADVGGMRELTPRVVVLGLGARDMQGSETPERFVERLSAVVGSLRAPVSGGTPPAVFLVGLAAPTLSQLEWSADDVAARDVATRQAEIDARTAAWDEALGTLADKDDGVWHVDLGWPAASDRGSLTRGGWALTDRAHARIGAVICEEILKNLGNDSK